MKNKTAFIKYTKNRNGKGGAAAHISYITRSQEFGNFKFGGGKATEKIENKEVLKIERKELRDKLNEYDFLYRTIYSPDPKMIKTKEEVKEMTEKLIAAHIKESGADENHVYGIYSIHENTKTLHSHIIFVGFTEQLQLKMHERMKTQRTVEEAQKQLVLEREGLENKR